MSDWIQAAKYATKYYCFLFFTLPILDYQRRRLSFGEEHHGNVNFSCLSIHRYRFILVLSYDINEELQTNLFLIIMKYSIRILFDREVMRWTAQLICSQYYSDPPLLYSCQTINGGDCRLEKTSLEKTRVSVQGVESLWGDCRYIPADWGSW